MPPVRPTFSTSELKVLQLAQGYLLLTIIKIHDGREFCAAVSKPSLWGSEEEDWGALNPLLTPGEPASYYPVIVLVNIVKVSDVKVYFFINNKPLYPLESELSLKKK